MKLAHYPDGSLLLFEIMSTGDVYRAVWILNIGNDYSDGAHVEFEKRQFPQKAFSDDEITMMILSAKRATPRH